VKRLAFFVGLVAGSVACSTPPANPQTFNFDVPTDVDFVCLDVLIRADGHILPRSDQWEPTPLPLTACRTDSTGRTTDSLTGPSGPHGLRLFALVPQRTRGEVAVVNLHPSIDTGVVDNDLAVPGYTFIPVGAIPVSIGVDPRGTVTYVANYADRTVTVLDNTRLFFSSGHRLATAGSTDASVQRVGFSFAVPPEDVEVVERPAATPGGLSTYFLYVTLPDAGQVAVIDVTNPRLPGPTTVVTLASMASRPGGVDGGGVDASLDAMGGTEAGVDAGSLMAHPRRIAVGDDGTVYVSDDAQTVMHVLRPDGNSLREAMPFDTGIPTVAIAISPTVPRVSGMERWIYAIGRADTHEYGRVIVLDAITGRRQLVNAVRDALCDPSRGSDNCLRVDPLLPFDHVPLVGPASAVTFVSHNGLNQDNCRAYTTPTAVCDSTSTDQGALPAVLRGLQAVVTLRSGQMQVIDIDDPDHDCVPGRTYAAGAPPFQIHAPRGAIAYLVPPSLVGAPSMLNNATAVSPGPELPSLVPLSSQPAGTMCTAANNYCIQLPTRPIAVREQTWNLTYEGVPPGLAADGADIVIDSTLPQDQVRIDAPDGRFCTLGALAGDRMTIVGIGPSVREPGRDAGLRSATDPMCDDCLGVFGGTTTPCNRDVDVVRVTETGAIVRLRAPERCSPIYLTSAMLRQRLSCCYPQAVRYEVHTAGVWTVVGGRTGFQHQVTAGPDGACVENPLTNNCDPMRRPLSRGRLTERLDYCSPWFSLRVEPGSRTDPATMLTETVATPRGLTFTFQTTGGFFPLVLEAGISPVAAAFVCPSQRLYLVDPQRNVLREYTVAPLAFARPLN